MKWIYFFDEKVKPIALRGQKALHPAETGKLGGGVSCIRQYDVNLWFYTKGDRTIAFDAGHLNYPGIEEEFEKIGIRPQDIRHLFLTHADVDHAGGIDISGNNIFPKAQVYLGKREEIYLRGEHHRFKRMGLKIKNCVRISPGYRLLEDEEVIEAEGISVQALHVPGHTLGHLCYLVDGKILISGDCLAVNEEGGYSFFDFFTQYPKLNKASLRQLKERLSGTKIEMVCTGHSGCYTETENLFAHIDESAPFSRKRAFDESAPGNLFKKSKRKRES